MSQEFEEYEDIEYRDFAYITFVYGRLLTNQIYDLKKLFLNIRAYYKLPLHYSVSVLESRVEKWGIKNLDDAKPYLVLTFTVFSHTGEIFIPETNDYCFGIEVSMKRNSKIDPLIIDAENCLEDELWWERGISQHFYKSGYADSHQKFIDQCYDFVDTRQDPFSEFE